MDEILKLLSESIDRLNEHKNSPITKIISNEINNVQFDKNFNGVSIFVDEISNVQQGLESVNSDGIGDSLKSIKKDLDHVAGQINTTIDVVDAGAGSHKAAEYVGNASESLQNALEKIDNLVEFIIGEGNYSDEVLTDNTEKVQSSATPAINDLENLKCALDNSLEELT
jgi:uncharacterized Zn finger protein